MFDLFRKKAAAPPQGGVPRAVLPTYVTDKLVVLSKAAPNIRNTYEVRLALYMAKSRNLRFVLAVRPGTTVEDSVRALLAEHGGAIEEAELNDYCVSIGWGFEEGEKAGWVLGDAAAFMKLQDSIQSPRLRELFHIGAHLSGATLSEVGIELAKEQLPITNIDKENVREALLTLVSEALKNNGALFVQ